jgi:hypothetical protein
MRKYAFWSLIFCAGLLFSCKKDNKSELKVTSETLSMGAGYANDVYYSLEKGSLQTAPRSNWDIAFHTNAFSSAIITNGGAGVQLYAKIKLADSTAWNTPIDTTGLSLGTVLYNSDTTWTLSAFERTAQGYPDYGWGTYNSTNHDIIGTELFIIKLANNQAKKVMITRKYSTLNKYRIWYANLDGSGDQKMTVDCIPYTLKNFVYFSFATNGLVDREPAGNLWDFVVTKYIQIVPGPGGLTPYPVVGILTNTLRLSIMGNISYTGVTAAKVNHVAVGTTDYSKAVFQTNISTIGYDWKSYNQATNTYTLPDSLVYFIKQPNKSVYKVVFTGFEGSSTGVVKFNKTKLN